MEHYNIVTYLRFFLSSVSKPSNKISSSCEVRGEQSHISLNKKISTQRRDLLFLRLYDLHTWSLALLSLHHTVLRKKINIVQHFQDFTGLLGKQCLQPPWLLWKSIFTLQSKSCYSCLFYHLYINKMGWVWTNLWDWLVPLSKVAAVKAVANKIFLWC